MRGPRVTLTILAAAGTLAVGGGAALGAIGPNPANHGALLDEPIEDYSYSLG